MFKETRLCLALLYSLLSQYCLREAQELGDHMARLTLHRAGHQKDNMTCITGQPWSIIPQFRQFSDVSQVMELTCK